MKRIVEILVNLHCLRKSRYFKITFGVSHIYAGFRTTTPFLESQVHHFVNFKKTNKL